MWVRIAAVFVCALSACTSTSTGGRTQSSRGRQSSAGVVAAGQFEHGTWTRIADARFSPRSYAIAVWTGREMIVFGGGDARGCERKAGGAAYDPVARAWRAIADAPPAARCQTAAVWDGREMLVWGGRTARGPAADGAAYDPKTDVWRAMPAAPVVPRVYPAVVWTGTRMIVVGGRPAVETESQRGYADGASFEPASGTWTAIPPAPLDKNHEVERTVAIWDGKEALVWFVWSASATKNGRITSMSGGADLFKLDPASLAWTAVPEHRGALPDVEEAMWGDGVAIVRGVPVNCGACSRPYIALQTSLYGPGVNAWRQIPDDPLGTDHQISAWTGRVLISFNGSTSAGSPAGAVAPGDATAFDLSTGTWVRLPRAPAGCDDGTMLWTGSAALLACSNAFLRFDPA